MVRAAQWLERRAGVSVESIGRAALDRKDSFTLIASGRNLSFQIRTDGGWLICIVSQWMLENHRNIY